MTNNPETLVLYIKDRTRWQIEKIDVKPLPNAFQVKFIGDYERTEIFEGVAKETLMNLLQTHFPQAFGLATDEKFLIVRKNGVPVLSAEDMEQALDIMQASAEYESLFSVADLSGQIVARYVSNRDGTLIRLGD